jgi:acetyl-CoA acetyltransferase
LERICRQGSCTLLYHGHWSGRGQVIPAVLDQCQLTIQDIDVFEINEAFALQAT